MVYVNKADAADKEMLELVCKYVSSAASYYVFLDLSLVSVYYVFMNFCNDMLVLLVYCDCIIFT